MSKFSHSFSGTLPRSEGAVEPCIWSTAVWRFSCTVDILTACLTPNGGPLRRSERHLVDDWQVLKGLWEASPTSPAAFAQCAV